MNEWMDSLKTPIPVPISIILQYLPMEDFYLSIYGAIFRGPSFKGVRCFQVDNNMCFVYGGRVISMGTEHRRTALPHLSFNETTAKITSKYVIAPAYNSLTIYPLQQLHDDTSKEGRVWKWPGGPMDAHNRKLSVVGDLLFFRVNAQGKVHTCVCVCVCMGGVSMVIIYLLLFYSTPYECFWISA